MRQPGKSWGDGIVRIRQRRHEQRLHKAHIKAIEMQNEIMITVYGDAKLGVPFWVITAVCLLVPIGLLGLVMGVM